jgi:hypothetical protein
MTINEIKKMLGIKRKQLILLEIYKQYNKDISCIEEAIDFMEGIKDEHKKFRRESKPKCTKSDRK